MRSRIVYSLKSLKKQKMDQSNVNNVIKLEVSDLFDLCNKWITILSPFHGMSKREMSMVSSMLAIYFDKKDSITDEEVLYDYIFSTNVKTNICKMLNMTKNQFQVLLRAIRQKGIINGNRINRHFIPNIRKEAGQFQVLFHFDFADGFSGSRQESISKGSEKA